MSHWSQFIDGKWRFVCNGRKYIKWDNLSGAAFSNSPLVSRRQYFTVGFSVSWISPAKWLKSITINLPAPL